MRETNDTHLASFTRSMSTSLMKAKRDKLPALTCIFTYVCVCVLFLLLSYTNTFACMLPNASHCVCVCVCAAMPTNYFCNRTRSISSVYMLACLCVPVQCIPVVLVLWWCLSPISNCEIVIHRRSRILADASRSTAVAHVRSIYTRILLSVCLVISN